MPATQPTPTPRPRSRRGEGDLLREDIVVAAERLLIRLGDEDAVSMRAIAEEAGVAPPSIYLHFSDKSELLFEVCERHFAALDAATQAAADQGLDPLDSLRRRGEAYIRFGLEHPEHYRIVFMGKPALTPSLWQAEKLSEAVAFQNLLENVEHCLAAGLLRDGTEPFLAAVGLWMSVHGAASLMISKPEFPWPPVDVVIDHILATHADGLAAPHE